MSGLQRLDGLINKTLTTSSINQIRSIHQKILSARDFPKTGIAETDLRKVIAQVCIENGIKQLPDELVVSLCMKSWLEKFESLMNLQEMKLAFEMNVNGDFPNKVEHYQAFSRDYFCNVLNRYIQQKQVVLMKEAKMPKNEHQSIAPPDNYSEKILLDIIQDRINSGSGSPLTESVPIATRFEMLCSMFEVNYGEKTIAGYRINACDELLRELTKKKNEAKALNKYGLELEITNQIARIKAQKLITEADEAMIEAKVLRLLYANVILHWPEMEFVNHVKESIQLLKNHAKSEKNNS